MHSVNGGGARGVCVRPNYFPHKTLILTATVFSRKIPFFIHFKNPRPQYFPCLLLTFI
uniref:Uncharacterized protein n=1 Tax=Anguilla anguilla TaxID=7936 RepID=A0A0E9XP73_ANGAN